MASRGGMNPDFMKQLQQMQGRIAEVQQRLDETVIEASSGGGAVTVKMNAHPSLQEITILPEVIDPDDAEMLQDLIQAAMNDALEKIRASQMQQLAGLAGGMQPSPQTPAPARGVALERKYLGDGAAAAAARS